MSRMESQTNGGRFPRRERDGGISRNAVDPFGLEMDSAWSPSRWCQALLKREMNVLRGSPHGALQMSKRSFLREPLHRALIVSSAVMVC